MKKNAALLLMIAATIAGCTDSGFKKGKEGMEYKIISQGNGKKLQYANYMQLAVATYYNTGNKDSLLSDSRATGFPVIELFDSLSTPPAYFEMVKQLKKGDSLVIRILSDSAFKKSPEQMPPFFKKGHYLLTTVKLIDIFESKDQADKARKLAMEEKEKKDSLNAIVQLSKDDKVLVDYLTKNNIKTVKAPKGTYVEIVAPGTGPNIDTSVVVKALYRGKTLEGKAFDSTRNREEPFSANLTNDPTLGYGVITGWKDGFSMLNKGAKARLYIPSSLGYGAMGAGEAIPPNANLVFDVEIVDVMNKEQAKSAAEAQRKKMMAIQKHYMDSVAKVKKLSPDSLKK